MTPSPPSAPSSAPSAARARAWPRRRRRWPLRASELRGFTSTVASREEVKEVEPDGARVRDVVRAIDQHDGAPAAPRAVHDVRIVALRAGAAFLAPAILGLHLASVAIDIPREADPLTPRVPIRPPAP